MLQFGAAGLGALALAACSGPTVSSGATGSGSSTPAGPGPGATSGSGGSSSSSGASSTASSGSNAYTGVTPAKTIDFWSDHPGGSGPLETQLVDAYNKSQSETVVNLVTAGKNYADIAQKFQTALASNKVPALVMVSDVWWFSYVLNKNTVPIEPLAEAVGLDMSIYNKTFYDDYLYNGSHWAVPYARSTPLFYYNKAHFAKAGLPDRAPKTWDEMDEFGKKLMAANLGTQAAYNWALPTNYVAWYYQNKAWGWGGEYSNQWDLSPIVGQGMIDSLTWAAKTMKTRGGWAGMTSNSQSNDLAAEVVSACLDSTGTIGSIGKSAKAGFQLGAGPLPGGPKATDHVCPTGGAGISISQKSGPAEQLAAMKFLAWLTNADNSVKFSASTGYLPVNTKADTATLVAKTPLIQVAINQLDHLRSQDWARVFITGGDQIIGNGIGEVLLKNTDPATAMKTVQGQLQTAYNQNIKPHLS
jgi:sn-glycerol 3-phosphate transport system substrate-binding protein